VKECPQCKNSVDAKETICPFCGNLLSNNNNSEATRTLTDTDNEEGTPRWGTAHFGTRTNLVVQVRGINKTFVFDAEDVGELVIGRVDPDTGEAPEINLEECDALNKGVSRRHASITKPDAKLRLIDKGSPNGTYLNGDRMVANQPRILRDGDEVRVGRLVLVVTFERVSPMSVGKL
jgi:pSer/pThr/pTyr-binding forkhead associated (FHA) protein